MRRRRAFEDRQAAIADRLAQPFQELGSAPGVDAVREPGDLAVAGGFQEALDGGQGLDALDGVRFRRELAQRDARGAAGHQGNVARRLRQRNQRHAAAVIVGIGDQLVRGLDPRIPTGGGAPAIVEQDYQWRPAAAGRSGLRIPDRSGGGQDHQRRRHQAQQCEPPWRARRSFLLRRDVEQQPRRRKFDAPGPRRHHPQQPPQHRQAEQAQQQHRFGKGQRQSGDHARTSGPECAGWRLLTLVWAPAPIRPWMANSSSVGPRSVR